MSSTERAAHEGPQMHRVYKGVNKPLTILGVERRLFFLATIIGAATFNFFGSLLGGVLMFALLYVLGLWSSANDPEILQIAMNSARLRSSYDPLKRESHEVTP